MIVLDASAAVEYLLGAEGSGPWAAGLLERARRVHAPALLDVEVAAALRGQARGGRIGPERAAQAMEDLARLRVTRWPHGPLMARAWQLRDVLSPYDACYVALAEMLDAPLATLDGALAAAVHDARIEVYPG